MFESFSLCLQAVCLRVPDFFFTFHDNFCQMNFSCYETLTEISLEFQFIPHDEFGVWKIEFFTMTMKFISELQAS